MPEVARQVGAIVGLRARLLVRRARGLGGVLNTISALLFGIVGTLISLGMAAGFGLLVAANTDDPLGTDFVYLIPFYVFLFFGIALPVIRGAIEQGFDARPFLVFPISRRRLYFVTLIAAFGGAEHAFYYPAILAITVAMLFVVGAAPLPLLATMLLLTICLVTWGNTTQLALAALMRTRRVREIVVIVAFASVLVVSVAPSVLLDRETPNTDGAGPALSMILRSVGPITGILPPSLAAGSLDAIAAGRTDRAWPSLAGLIGWCAAGMLVGSRAFGAYLSPKSGSSPRASRRTSSARRRFTVDHPWLRAIPIETRAVAAKELRYLFRSVVGRFILVMVPLFAMLVGGVFAAKFDRELLGVRPDTMLLFGLLLYSVMFSNNFVNNAFAWESDGIQTYFLSPAPLTRVILGKNIGVWVFNIVVLTLLLATWTLLVGFPGWTTSASAVLLFWILLVIVTTSGNFLSILFPIGRSMSSMMNSPSQTAILLSFLALGFGSGLIATSLALAWAAEVELLLPVFLIWILAGVVGLYAWSVRISARLLDERRGRVIEALRNVR